jgi:heat shock protein HslJ
VRGVGIATAFVLVSALVGCGGSTDSKRADDATAGREARKSGFQGRQVKTFASARRVCEIEPRSEFAANEGLPADATVTALARGYASEWPQRLRRAAFEGCRAGLANVPARFPASTSAAREIWGRNFIATEVVGDEEEPPVARPLEIRLFFSGEGEHSVGWKARCNGFGGDVRFTATKMEVDGGGSTLVGCMPEAEEEDEWLSEFMQADPEWRLDGQRLRLISQDTTLELRGFEDPNTCPISPDGGRVERGNGPFDCEGALNFVILHVEGKDGYLRGWNCRDTKSADGQLGVVCRDGEKWFAARGLDPSLYKRRSSFED